MPIQAPLDPVTGLPVPAGPGGTPAVDPVTGLPVTPGEPADPAAVVPVDPAAPGAPATPVNAEPTIAPDTVVMDDGTSLDCTTLQRPPTPLRRLTRSEYNNSVRDLLNTTLTPASIFPPDEVSGGFSNNALVLTVSSLHAEKYVEAAEMLAAEAVTNINTSGLLPCDSAAGEEACAREFATVFGRLAYRRALETEDVDALMEAYAAGDTFEKGIEVMIRAVLQSPHFLYRVEFTGTETPGVGMVRTSGYETASRLSYLIWASGPDDALLDTAEAGGLDTPEQVAATARQMLQDPKARNAIAEFYRQWLGMTRLETATKDASAFPLWSDEMRAAMQAETGAVVEQVLWGSATPTLSALLTTPVGLPTGPLATLYGIPASETAVTLPATERSGVLTLPGFLAAQAHPDQTSPVLRGKFVRTKLMCTPPPIPPPNADITPPDPSEGGTARQRFSAHAEDAECASCHQLMDPLGFAFENYDAIGSYRTMDAGQPVDVSGEVVLSEDMDGPFMGVSGLAAKLADSEQVRDCVASQWYTYAVGRSEEVGDTCSLNPLQQAFGSTGADLVELIVGTTQTEAFLYRRAELAQ
jgi:hypothetical protein